MQRHLEFLGVHGFRKWSLRWSSWRRCQAGDSTTTHGGSTTTGSGSGSGGGGIGWRACVFDRVGLGIGSGFLLSPRCCFVGYIMRETDMLQSCLQRRQIRWAAWLVSVSGDSNGSDKSSAAGANGLGESGSGGSEEGSDKGGVWPWSSEASSYTLAILMQKGLGF